MRKTRVKGGDQHAMSVRIDNDLWEWLQGEPNKNRLINELLTFWRRSQITYVNYDLFIRNIRYKILEKAELKLE